MKITTTESPTHVYLEMIRELVYEKCGMTMTNLEQNSESLEYGACSFELDRRAVEYRVSKITPKKAGQFVTLWKRNENGITVPFDISDKLDFVLITSMWGDKTGQFIFPKSVLVEKGIVSQDGRGGKRGIRVYPSWDRVTSKQAQATQDWQLKFFVTIGGDGTPDPDFVKKMMAGGRPEKQE